MKPTDAPTIDYDDLQEGDYIMCEGDTYIFKLADDNNVPRNMDQTCPFKTIPAPGQIRQLGDVRLNGSEAKLKRHEFKDY